MFGLIASALLIAGAQESSDRYKTLLTPNGQGIVRHPGPADFSRIHGGGPLKELPAYNPSSKKGWQVDLRSTDVSGLDLSGRITDLLYADFDDKTRWPQMLPKGFEPARIMELGKSPGFSIRKLHDQGLTGKGVGIAIIDQGLLVDHIEYKDRLRLYEEIHCGDGKAAMHGAAVASIAVGKTIGVAPEADLYFIAETHGIFHPDKPFDWDFTYLAQSIDRILEVNRNLPKERKIRVISISVGWDPQRKGYAEVNAAVERVKNEGIFVISSSLSETSGNKFGFHGLGREPLANPEMLASYRPGLWWMDNFYAVSNRLQPTIGVLLVPMDSRCTASPTGIEDYVFYRQGGWSWSIPYLAGLYALACQAKPDLTPEEFWSKSIETGDSLMIPARRPLPSEEQIEKEIRKMVEERMAMLKEQTKGKDPNKAMADVYTHFTGQKRETMTEPEFREWMAVQVREFILGDTKPKELKTIINPGRLIDALRKGR